ncbi:uncharacterized protein LOC131958574 [Physella acuta]|uniref:uncharacterized protein LOC131958574 n=1 Tax=Physella acuta TaxID=109671 RepID=UPI0027DB1E0F|nr:uncharacterized protein LOC131958574 [Physella acuta]
MSFEYIEMSEYIKIPSEYDDMSSDHNEMSSDHNEMSSEHNEMSERIKMSSEHDDMSSGHNEISSGHNEMSSEHIEMSSDYNEMSSGLTKTSSDLNAVSSDHKEMSSGHNLMSSDHKEMSSGHNLRSSDQMLLTSDDNNVSSDQSVTSSNHNNMSSRQIRLSSRQDQDPGTNTRDNLDVLLDIVIRANSPRFDSMPDSCSNQSNIEIDGASLNEPEPNHTALQDTSTCSSGQLSQTDAQTSAICETDIVSRNLSTDVTLHVDDVSSHESKYALSDISTSVGDVTLLMPPGGTNASLPRVDDVTCLSTRHAEPSNEPQQQEDKGSRLKQKTTKTKKKTTTPQPGGNTLAGNDKPPKKTTRKRPKCKNIPVHSTVTNITRRPMTAGPYQTARTVKQTIKTFGLHQDLTRSNNHRSISASAPPKVSAPNSAKNSKNLNADVNHSKTNRNSFTKNNNSEAREVIYKREPEVPHIRADIYNRYARVNSHKRSMPIQKTCIDFSRQNPFVSLFERPYTRNELRYALPKTHFFSCHDKALKDAGYQVEDRDVLRKAERTKAKLDRFSKLFAQLQSGSNDKESNEISTAVVPEITLHNSNNLEVSRENSDLDENKVKPDDLSPEFDMTCVRKLSMTSVNKRRPVSALPEYIDCRPLTLYLQYVNENRAEFLNSLQGSASRDKSNFRFIQLGQAFELRHQGGRPREQADDALVVAAKALRSRTAFPLRSGRSQAMWSQEASLRVGRGGGGEEELVRVELEKRRVKAEEWARSVSTYTLAKAKLHVLRELGSDDRELTEWWEAFRSCHYLRQGQTARADL